MRSDVELLRIVSALGIVWFHSKVSVGRDIAYAGLVIFLIFSSYFAVHSKKIYTIQLRAKRLLIPCALWSLLFAGLDLVQQKNVYPDNYSLVSKIFATPSIHLWFLPFLFFCLILIDYVKAALNPKILASIASVAASILIVASPQWRQLTYLPPLGQYMHALPAILIGMLFALSSLIGHFKYILFSLLGVSLIYTYTLHISGISITYFIGVILSSMLLREHSFLPENRVVFELSKLTFGIYLIHPLILFMFRRLGLIGELLPILTFIFSSIFVYIILKFLPESISKYVL